MKIEGDRQSNGYRTIVSVTDRLLGVFAERSVDVERYRIRVVLYLGMYLRTYRCTARGWRGAGGKEQKYHGPSKANPQVPVNLPGGEH